MEDMEKQQKRMDDFVDSIRMRTSRRFQEEFIRDLRKKTEEMKRNRKKKGFFR